MIDYGEPPAADEIEVTLFGPGFGEAIAIHLSDNKWMLVDSCIDPTTKEPASVTYLTQLGVPGSHVRAIVASHWHDDHVRGISRVSAMYPNAEFLLSSLFNDNEAAYFLSAYSGNSAPGQARGGKELFQVIKQHENVFYVHQRSIVFEFNHAGRRIAVTAISPVQGAVAQCVARMASYLPAAQGGTPINHAPVLEPNIEAVALHIDVGDDAILLGSDLEEHATLGWSAVVSDSWCASRRKGTAYKLAHHGSYTGDIPQIWATLLQPDPTACLTPFILGKHRLPTDADRVRVKGNTPNRYISSGATRKPDMNSAQLKRLSDMCKNLSRVNPGFGAVRLRKRFGGSRWTVECFGQAQAMA